MKELDKIFSAYKTLLETHIATKTTAPFFHEKSAEFYELGFDVFHAVSEKLQDVGEVETVSCDEGAQTAYKALEDMKEAVESLVRRDNTVGMDNLLRGLVDKLESACGNARAFIAEETEEDSETPEKPEAKKNSILTPKK